MKQSRPVQRSGRYAGQPYQQPQSVYARQYGATLRTVKRWWKDGRPCDDADAMGEFLSSRGRKPNEPAATADDFAEDAPRDQTDAGAWLADELAVTNAPVLDETFLDGVGLVPAMGRISKLERAFADKLMREFNKPGFNFREVSNRFGSWVSTLKIMGKIEKDAPGILEKNKNQIDVGEVQEGVTKLLLDVVGRLALVKVRCRQPLAAMSDPQEIEDFVDHEISIALDPIRKCEWMPAEHRPVFVEERPTADTPPRVCASGPSSKKRSRRRSSSGKT